VADDDLVRKFKQAAEIAKLVPRNLQETAFNRALDQLIGAGGSGATVRSTASERVGPAKQRARRGEPAFQTLFENVNRTQYPDLISLTRVADRAMRVLQLANDEHQVDGLTATQIAAILTKIFRVPTSASAINMALDRAGESVNVRRKDGAKTFHLMSHGEARLRGLSNRELPDKKRTRSKAPKRTRSETVSNGGDAAHGEPKKTRRTTGRPGPKATIEQLVTEGFFGTPRTITAIQEHTKHKLGRSFTVQELSPALLRLIRDKTLARDRSSSGQYEYTGS
jgi:hypothetical protein